MRIYIAGKITGDKNYKKKFAIIHVSDTSSYTKDEAIRTARETLKKKLNYVKEVVLVYDDKVHYLK